MAGDKTDNETGRDAPRQTYMPKPPSKEEVDQVSREQGMISDEWTGDPREGTGAAAPENEPPPLKKDEA